MKSEHDYGPSLALMRLYERETRHGKPYLIGRLGLAKIIIWKSDEVSDTGHTVWNAFVQEGPQKALQPAEEGSGATMQQSARRRRRQRRQAAEPPSETEPQTKRTGTFDDPVPF